MIRCKLCFAAEGVMNDAETRQFSVFGVIEDLQAPNFPATLPRLTLLTMWERSISDAPKWGAELSVSLNGQELIARQIVSLDFAHLLRTRATIRLEGLQVTEPGRLTLRLAIPGHDTAEWGITVGLAPPAGAAVGVAVPAAVKPMYESLPVSMTFGTTKFDS